MFARILFKRVFENVSGICMRILDSWATPDAESEADTFNVGEIDDALDEVTILHEE
ncbi:hypothetical protein PR003_g4798 [Phytophthora rubi]|uniref:Uncharacterized protein n=1 Tax=Phytophthora rubi TaxID=129364 RepID=A0A6A4FRY7_9STRA|nr:hypothetical protein PR003_g4798 [Phytophthora rubi]